MFEYLNNSSVPTFSNIKNIICSNIEIITIELFKMAYIKWLYVGLESIDVNMKDKKLTVTGDIDPVIVVTKLRKLCPTHILTVGPAKEEKKVEPKKDEPKKDNGKADVALPKIAYPMPYYSYNYNQYQPPPMNTHYYRPVVQEDPNSCVIC